MDRQTYNAECAQRWEGPALNDARRNWGHFEELRPLLEPALRAYLRDPSLEDVRGVKHNPEGTLTAMLWKLQESMQPDGSRLSPLLDFEERYQKVFLRRGLVPYCKLLLRDMETVELERPEQKTLTF